MGTTAVLPVSFRSQTASSNRPFAFLPTSPNTSPHTNGGFSPCSSRRPPPHRFFLAEQSKSSARGQECKRAAATMDSSSRRWCSLPLLLLPEDLIIRILLLHLEDRHGMTPSTRYAGLRHVCAMFRWICDSPEVLCRLQLRGIRQYLRRWPSDSWTRFRIACASPVIARPSASLGCR